MSAADVERASVVNPGWIVVLNGPPRQPGIYDLEIDTSAVTPEIAAAMIRERLEGPAPTAPRELAGRG